MADQLPGEGTSTKISTERLPSSGHVLGKHAFLISKKLKFKIVNPSSTKGTKTINKKEEFGINL